MTNIKKGQIEIAGLIIIVVLITLVLLFVLSFDLNQDIANQGDETRELKDTNIRDGFGPALLETSTSCESRTVKQLLSDCAHEKEISCANGNSCFVANQTIEYILNETLEKIGYKFTLAVKKGDAHVTFFNDTGCLGDGDIFVPAVTPFQTDYGSMTLIITQCS
jgi:hypothetical protein